MTIQLLDLNKVRLFCYENRISDKRVESIIRGIELNESFPAVSICFLEKDNYLLLRPEGGHARAVGNYLSNELLKIDLKSLDEEIQGYASGQKVRDFVTIDWPRRIFIGDIPVSIKPITYKTKK